MTELHECQDCDTFPYETAEDLEYHRRCAHQGVNAKTRQPRNYSDNVARHTARNGNTVTPKQMDFIKKLIAERPDVEKVEEIRGGLNECWKQGLLTKALASTMIDALMAIPKPKKAKAATPELDDGVYEVGGNYFLVYHTVHGANQQVAKELAIHEGGTNDDGSVWYEGEWMYRGKAPLRRLLPEHKLSEADARKFGSVYGICVRCARHLTADESKYVGYGATCAGHEGWWYPTAAELRELTKEAAE